jgi:hypothetical protein
MDDQFADRWTNGLGRPISHLEHVGIARTFLLRHSRVEATRRLVVGTRLNCALEGVPERFDAELTTRWTDLVADALDEHGPLELDALIEAAPHLADSRFLGTPRR